MSTSLACCLCRLATLTWPISSGSGSGNSATAFPSATPVNFNYDTEPLPGHYPGRLGLPLLRESRLNHLGKLAFQQFYWHGLLPGYDVPGISSAMPERGKSRPPDQAAAAGTSSHR